jgi:hypothetical protein
MWFGFALVLLAGCTETRLAAVPEASTNEASVLSISDARFFDDKTGLDALAREAAASNVRERTALGLKSYAPLPPASFLALSGGGDDGAFGSGLLVGWTAHGGRPTFKIVTGVSTGALSAPFAFLGSDYDASLKNMYTEITASDVMSSPSLLSAVGGDSVSDSRPLHQMILRYLTDDVVRRIAEEYRKGRLLFVASTNLDAGRATFWNIGAIASSENPKARALIARILLASASVPAAVPPVLINVDVGSKHFQEMHVDGGATAQAFLYPPGITSGVRRHYTAYIIRNGRLGVPWKQVNQETLAIAGRAVSTLIAASGVDDMYRMYLRTKHDGIAFNLAYIRDDFNGSSKGPFDPRYMNSLFDYAYAQARAGYRWDKLPPYLDVSEAAKAIAPAR